ncbi:MAG: TRAP transporter small permease subunit [Loktanella sp.]|nr:TRAP transporter small permease subunit [Loktanella sp.]
MATDKPQIVLDLDKIEAAASTPAFEYPRTWLSDKIEWVIDLIGGLVNWVWLLLVLIIVSNVLMRYVLSTNYVWIEEIQWHIYAVGFMIGIGYTLRHDGHVRVDVVAAMLKPRTRAIFEFLGIVLFILPLVVLMISYAIPFVERSWVRNEVSSAPGGLSNRWAIKSVIIVAFVLIGLAASARLLRVGAFLMGKPTAPDMR